MSHAYKALYYHCIWSTAERRPLIFPLVRPRLYKYIAAIAQKNDCNVMEIGGTSDHVHVLIQSAKPDLTDCLRDIKACSSGWLRDEFVDLSKFRWQKGSGMFTVSYSAIDDVRRYIQNQEKHHVKYSFEQEFLKFLQCHGIMYDERHAFG